jgi:hypothetical protein
MRLTSRIPYAHVLEAINSNRTIAYPARRIASIVTTSLILAAPMLLATAVVPRPSLATSSDQAVAASRIATILEGRGKLSVRRRAVRNALSLGGVGVTRNLTQNIIEGAPPAAPQRVMEFQVVNMTAELSRRGDGGMVTLVQLERSLRDLGVPLRPGRPGLALRRFFQVWIRGAQADPTDPESFTPLLLRELALRKNPRIDLAATSFDPKRVRLGALELDLVVAAFFRGAPATVIKPSSSPRSLAAASEESGPCSSVLEELDKPLGWAPAVAGGAVSSWDEFIKDETKKVIRDAMNAASNGKIQVSEEQFDQFMLGVNVLAEVINTQALYANLEIEVIPQYEEIHAPIERPNTANAAITHFAARVGIDQDVWSAYQEEMERSSPAVVKLVEALRDCLRSVGVPAFFDLEEVAGQINKFHVKWRLEALNRVARINPQASHFSSRDSHSLELVNPSQALTKGSQAGLAVDILPVRESKLDHAQGCLVPDSVTARAELNLNVPPKAETVKRVIGPSSLEKLPTSVIDLVFGMFRAIKFIPASGTTIVVHHEGAAGLRTSSTLAGLQSLEQRGGLQCKQPGREVIEADITITTQMALSWHDGSRSGTFSISGSTNNVRVALLHDDYAGNGARTRGAWEFLDPAQWGRTESQVGQLIRGGAPDFRQNLTEEVHEVDSDIHCDVSVRRQSYNVSIFAYDSKHVYIDNPGAHSDVALRCPNGDIPSSEAALEASVTDDRRKGPESVPIVVPMVDILKVSGAILDSTRISTRRYLGVVMTERNTVTVAPVCSYFLQLSTQGRAPLPVRRPASCAHAPPAARYS